jgi:hypothetical protein
MNSYQGPPNISAGIFGRMGPGGGSLGTGVNARLLLLLSHFFLEQQEV